MGSLAAVARSIQLTTEGFPGRPGMDIAVSRALLLAASDGDAPETFRLHRPGRVVAFGKRDTLEPGYEAAARESRRRGYEAVERLAGGRAAVFHEGTLAFSWSIPDPAPREGIGERFEALTTVVLGALSRLGIADGRVGEIPGEYCPGTYSVNVGGTIKVMGVGQRLAKRAAHVGGVIVVTGSHELRDILAPVYERLALPWRPETGGALEDVADGLTLDDVERAVVDELSSTHRLTHSRLAAGLLEHAELLAPEHLAPG